MRDLQSIIESNDRAVAEHHARRIERLAREEERKQETDAERITRRLNAD